MGQPESKPRQRRAVTRRQPKGGTRVVCREGTLGLGPNLALGDVSGVGRAADGRRAAAAGQEVEVVLSGPGVRRDIVRHGEVVWSLAGPDGTSRVGVRFHKPLDYANLQDLGRLAGA